MSGWATSKRKRVLQWQLAERDGKACFYCDMPLILTDEIGTRGVYDVCYMESAEGRKSEPVYSAPPGHGFAQIDHVHPRSKGGSNNLSNLVLSCVWCHAKKGARV